MRIKKYFSKLILAAPTLLVFFAWPKPAFAFFDIVELATESVYKIFLATVTFAIDFIGSFLITFTGSIVSYVFSFQSFIEVPIVQIGWTISRDLANMVFILIMLLIAFGTVLRLEQYSVKKLIPKLVVAALLINFSLIICGAVIDFGNSLALFFVSGGRPGESVDVAAGIMGAMRAGAIAQLRNTTAADSPVSTLLMVSLGQLIMYIIIAFTLLALAGVMISRIIQLWILIIFAPFAWVARAIPGKSSGYSSKWWSKFFDLAVIFPVSISFFLFLAILTGATFQSTNLAISDVGGWWAAVLPETTISTIMQFLVVVALLWLGLDQAGKAGSAGGNMVVKWAGGAKNWALGKITGGVKGGFKAIPGTPLRVADRFTGGGASRQLAKGLGWMEKKPGIGRAIGGPGAAYVRQQAVLKATAGKFEKLRPSDIEARLKQTAFTPEGLAERAGMVQTLINKGQFTLDTKDEFRDVWKNYLQTFQNMGGSVVDLIKKRPDLALDAGIQQMIVKDINAPPPVKTKWKEVTDDTNIVTKEEKIKKILDEDIFKTAADFGGIQKESFDMKGKLTGADKNKYEQLEREKAQEKERWDTENKLYQERMEALKAEITATRNRGEDYSNLQIQFEAYKENEKRSIQTYTTNIKKLQDQQIQTTGKVGQKLLLDFIAEQSKISGTMTAGNLNSLSSKNKAGYLEVLKHLKSVSPGMEGQWKDSIYRHVVAGEVINTMPDPMTAAAAPAPTP